MNSLIIALTLFQYSISRQIPMERESWVMWCQKDDSSWGNEECSAEEKAFEDFNKTNVPQMLRLK